MANPGELNEIWASDPNAVIDTPPDALEAAGWSAGQPPTAAHVNYLFNKASSWWSYLTAAIDDASTVFYFKAASTFTSLRLHMVGGANAWLQISKTTGDFDFQHGSGATNCLKVTADGLKGPTAVAGASTGIRYGYPSGSPLVCVVDCSPSSGGWTFGNNQAFNIYLTGGVLWLGNITAGSETFVAVHPVGLIGSAASLVRTVQAVSLSGRFSLTGDNVTIELVQKHRTTGAVTTLLSIASTATTDTDNNGGTPIDLDPYTYTYYVEMTPTSSMAAAAVTDQVIDVTLTLNKFSVEG